ncbi:hypothetical protein KIN20_024476 [Parelaphostrongylus tenuis]|uniref:Peptidase C1A papain C-terminal domain-containing protein n=1 Tax=Parelaphostrongylus tenuis TaxID=148309 RepID=A0AAD5N878_PARTN|nr:hypothetical protein KIN20_024476 [Parelaphostrongylus tenuis]
MEAAIVALVLAVAALAAVVPEPKRLIRGTEHLKGNDLVEHVNKAQNLFKAKLSPRFANVPDDIKRRIMGSRHVALPEKYRVNEKRHDDIDDSTIPKSFDAREHWPECPSLYSIRDQSSCGSCWAVAAAEAMTDRICIESKGNTRATISADDLLSCCTDCGDGCDGGFPPEAWLYWTKVGIVTGGNYTSKSGCKPYPYPPCEHHIPPKHYKQCPKELYETNACEHSCQHEYDRSYKKDKHYGASSYAVAPHVPSIQKEIMRHGPVEVSFEVYADFEHYSSGIYKYTAGDYLGGHAVKMLGWGTENGVDYWICANSWNEDWGENGFFRIRRGVDECGIESGVVAGLPK